MLKLIQRLLIIALALFILMFVYLNMAEACGNWVLEYSDRVGGRSGKMVNYCYYQDLSGSGQALSVQMPTYKECPVILDPCPEGGSDTTVTINQPTPEKTYAPPAKTYDPYSKVEIERWYEALSEAEKAEHNSPENKRRFQESYSEFLKEQKLEQDYNDFLNGVDKKAWEKDYIDNLNGRMSTKKFNAKWADYGVYK